MAWKQIQHGMQRASQWLKGAITEPRSELGRWERAARWAYDLGRYGAKQLREDQAPQMAAALAYRTLFGLLPVLVVGTMLVKAVGGFDQFLERSRDFLNGLGLNDFEVQAEQEGATGVLRDQTLSEWLLDLIAEVQNISLAAITWIGVAVLIYAAIGLMMTIEGSFNAIYRAPQSRPWSRQLPIYWTVLTLGPAAIALVVYLDGLFEEFITTVVTWRLLLGAAQWTSSFIAIWAFMFVLYRLVPNANVRNGPAIGGAFIAALLIELGKRTLGAYLDGAMSVSLLYGSLGLIPLFMLWIYIMWLVILFGLEISATIQMLGGRAVEEMEAKPKPTGVVEPAAIVGVMEVIAQRFRNGQASSPAEIAEIKELPEPTVRLMIEKLLDAGFLHRVEGRGEGQSAVTLSRPPEQIDARQLIDLGFSFADAGEGPGREFIEKLREAQRKLAGTATLAGLLPPPAETTGDQVPAG